MKLTGKTILITGGATGIGLGLAEALLERSNQVVICALTQSDVDYAKQQLPHLQGFVCDICVPEQIDALLDQIEAAGLELDVLINNAGILSTPDLLNRPLESIDLLKRDINVFVFAMIDLTQKVLARYFTNQQGLIINVGSPAGVIPVAQMPGYSLSKAAVHSYSQSLRYQLADTAIKVVEVFPPSVDTQISKTNGRKDISPREFAQLALKEIESDKAEVWIGDSKIVRWFTKLPRMFAFNTINRAVPLIRQSPEDRDS